MINLFLVTLLFFSLEIKSKENDKPLVIAHRGASSYAPENTLAAIKKGIELGAHYVEIDVRMTKDGKLVLIHDAKVNRTTDGEGNVNELTLSEIKLLDAGSWFDPKFKNEKIPTLDEVFSILDAATTLIIELKDDPKNISKMINKVIRTAREQGQKKKIILKSFNPKVLEEIRKQAPEFPLIYVYAIRIPFLNYTFGTRLSTEDLFSLNVDYLQPHSLLLTEGFVKDAQAKGYKIIAWDVDSKNNMKRMIRIGVDAIETNQPELLMKIIKEKTY
ncbi:MAG: hypothetical protein C0425_05635 [Chlorobiaceae bacterium]|nr:hypothetical protein [Chlorobiaceae bacterium]